MDKSPNNNNNSQGQENNNSPWQDLKNVAQPEAAAVNEPQKAEQPEAEAKNPEKTFMQSELERIARATGRVPDDPDVLKLNLALRYDQYERMAKMYSDHQDKNKNTNTKTTLQSGTMEDIATAKRELEEAMYLVDPKFKKIDEEQKRHNLKIYASRSKHLGEGVGNRSNSWVQAVRSNKDIYGQKRGDETDKMIDGLADLVKDIKSKEIYDTYELHKEAEQPIRERRQGVNEAGEKGLFTSKEKTVTGKHVGVDKAPDVTSGKSSNFIDWKLYPHAPEPAKAEKANNSNAELQEQMTNLTQQMAVMQQAIDKIWQQLSQLQGSEQSTPDFQKKIQEARAEYLKNIPKQPDSADKQPALGKRLEQQSRPNIQYPSTHIQPLEQPWPADVAAPKQQEVTPEQAKRMKERKERVGIPTSQQEAARDALQKEQGPDKQAIKNQAEQVQEKSHGDMLVGDAQAERQARAEAVDNLVHDYEQAGGQDGAEGLVDKLEHEIEDLEAQKNDDNAVEIDKQIRDREDQIALIAIAEDEQDNGKAAPSEAAPEIDFNEELQVPEGIDKEDYELMTTPLDLDSQQLEKKYIEMWDKLDNNLKARQKILAAVLGSGTIDGGNRPLTPSFIAWAQNGNRG